MAQIDQALAAGVVHYQRGHCPTRAGALRTTQVLAPGPPPTKAASTLSADELVALRERAGLSQQDLAGRLGISRGLVHRWEHRHQPIPGWAAETISHLLLTGRPFKGRRERMLRDLIALIRAHPDGITRRAIRGHLGNSPLTRHTIDQAVRAQLITSAPVTYLGAGGGRRVTTHGLVPATTPQPTQEPPTGQQVRKARQQAGWTLESAAQRLGVNASTLAKWERADRPLPAWTAPAARALLAGFEADTSPERQRREIMKTIRAAPTTREQLERGGGGQRGQGRSRQVQDALNHLLATGRVIEAHRPVPNTRGKIRLLKVLTPHDERHHPTNPPNPLRAAELGHLRRQAGLTRGQLGSLLDPPVSKVAVGHWETSRQPINPARTAQLRAALARTGPATNPLHEQVRHTDQQLEEITLHALAANPGITATQLAALIPGSSQRRLTTITRLIHTGKITAATTAKHYRDGRTYQARALTTTPAP